MNIGADSFLGNGKNKAKYFFYPQNESFMENVKKFVYICSFKQKN